MVTKTNYCLSIARTQSFYALQIYIETSVLIWILENKLKAPAQSTHLANVPNVALAYETNLDNQETLMIGILMNGPN